LASKILSDYQAELHSPILALEFIIVNLNFQRNKMVTSKADVKIAKSPVNEPILPLGFAVPRIPNDSRFI